MVDSDGSHKKKKMEPVVGLELQAGFVPALTATL